MPKPQVKSIAAVLVAGIIVDVLVGYPTLHWWQRIPHDALQFALGGCIWLRVYA